MSRSGHEKKEERLNDELFNIEPQKDCRKQTINLTIINS